MTSLHPDPSPEFLNAAHELADAIVEAVGHDAAARIANALHDLVECYSDRVDPVLQRCDALLMRLEDAGLAHGDAFSRVQSIEHKLEGIDKFAPRVDVVGHDDPSQSSMVGASKVRRAGVGDGSGAPFEEES